MPVRFKRQRPLSKAEQRRVRQLRLVEKIRRQPSVGVSMEATTGKGRKKGQTGRTAGDNITIFRTHRKRRRKQLTISKKEMKAIQTLHTGLRIKLQDTGARSDLRAYANAVGLSMQKLIKQKIMDVPLWETGQLHRSVIFETDNV